MAFQQVQDQENAGDAFGRMNAELTASYNSRMIPCHNNTGAEIPAGKVVYTTGTHANGKAYIAVANSSSDATMPGRGITTAAIADGGESEVQVFGELTMDTSAFAINKNLYVDDSGDLTMVPPTGASSKIQNFAYVTRVHASSGSIQIIGSGRANALPNLTQNKTWVGDVNGVPQEADVVDQTDIDWILGSSEFSAPTIAYAAASIDTEATGTIDAYVLSGTTPVEDWQVTTGSLPSEFSLNATTGQITYTTTTATGSGSFGVTATTPAGSSAEFTVNWAVEASQGAAEFLNTLNVYPGVRVTTSNSISTQYLLKQAFYGKLSGTSTGLIVEDSAHPIYAGSNGDGTWNYLFNISGYSYQMFFKNSTTDPATLADSLATDITTSGLTYDLVAPVSDSIVRAGVNYPSDRSDIHYISQLRYIDFGQDASLDNFATDAGSWSYGFELEEDWPADGLGRCMFTRAGRNWLAVAVGHSDTYSEMIIGNGSSRTYDSSEVASVSGGFSAGDFVRVTFDGSVIRFYVNGTLYYDFTSATSYMDGSSANSLDLTFGNGVESNAAPTSESYGHGKWQGLISRLWIANGTAVSTDDDGVTFPTGTTHSWLLSETTGKTFAANTGSVVGTGVKS